jgi:hypothetical protein
MVLVSNRLASFCHSRESGGVAISRAFRVKQLATEWNGATIDPMPAHEINPDLASLNVIGRAARHELDDRHERKLVTRDRRDPYC